MSWTIRQVTPQDLLEQKHILKDYLKNEISPLITAKSWMQDWTHIAGRFKLLQLENASDEEIIKHQWNYLTVRDTIDHALSQANEHLPLVNTNILVVPALPFKWFEHLDQSMWSNAFTLGPNTIILAVPPKPNLEFLKYLVAHEAHHACHLNPIYRLSLSNFTLEEWFKMEGTAEYFSLSLFADLRWWKQNLNHDMDNYWLKVKPQLKTTDDLLKSKLCFGDTEQNIPVFAGYCFAYELVRNYVHQHPIEHLFDLYSVTPNQLMSSYEKGR